MYLRNILSVDECKRMILYARPKSHQPKDWGLFLEAVELSLRLRIGPFPNEWSEGRVQAVVQLLYWNSCGIARHFERVQRFDEGGRFVDRVMGVLKSREPEKWQEQLALHALARLAERHVDGEMLRAENVFDFENSMFLRDVATVEEEMNELAKNRQVTVSDMTAMRKSAGRVKLTSEMMLAWSDSSFMHYEDLQLGFSHPRIVRAVLDHGQREHQYLPAVEELSLQYPYGPVGQGSVEGIYLETFAAGNTAPSPLPRALRDGAAARELWANAVCHPHLDRSRSIPRLEAFGRVYYPKQPDERVTVETLGKIWDERGSEWVLNHVWQLEENAAGIDAVLLLEHDEYRAILFLQLKAKALRGTDGKRLVGDPTLRTAAVVTKMHQHGAALFEPLCRMADWDSAAVIPWFVVVTTKRVADPGQVSTQLCGAKFKGGRPVANAARSYLSPVVGDMGAPVRGIGCVLARKMLYAAWPRRIRRWAEHCRYSPWYCEEQTPAATGRKRHRQKAEDQSSDDRGDAAPASKAARLREGRRGKGGLRGRRNRQRRG